MRFFHECPWLCGKATKVRTAGLHRSLRATLIAPGTQAQRAHLARTLAQQLSVGLWLMPFAFSKLGWAAAGIALSVSSCATAHWCWRVIVPVTTGGCES